MVEDRTEFISFKPDEKTKLHLAKKDYISRYKCATHYVNSRQLAESMISDGYDVHVEKEPRYSKYDQYTLPDGRKLPAVITSEHGKSGWWQMRIVRKSKSEALADGLLISKDLQERLGVRNVRCDWDNVSKDIIL